MSSWWPIVTMLIVFSIGEWSCEYPVTSRSRNPLADDYSCELSHDLAIRHGLDASYYIKQREWIAALAALKAERKELDDTWRYCPGTKYDTVELRGIVQESTADTDQQIKAVEAILGAPPP